MGRGLQLQREPLSMYNAILDALKQYTPVWVSKKNPQIYTAVALIIETYYAANICYGLLSGASYLRAVPRDCSWIIFKNLRGTILYVDELMRQFVGRRSRHSYSECYGVPGRPENNKYMMIITPAQMNVSYKRETLFIATNTYASFRLCGYNHDSGLVLGGLAATKFRALMAGAEQTAGVELLPPQRIKFDSTRYRLEYYCRGFLLASTFIYPGRMRTYFDNVSYNGPYLPEMVTPERKRRIISGPL